MFLEFIMASRKPNPSQTPDNHESTTPVWQALQAQAKQWQDAARQMGEQWQQMSQPFVPDPSPALGKLESIFEQRVAQALAVLNIPRSSDLEQLQRRIEVLEAQLAQAHATQAKEVAASGRARKSTGSNKPATAPKAPRNANR